MDIATLGLGKLVARCQLLLVTGEKGSVEMVQGNIYVRQRPVLIGKSKPEADILMVSC